MTGSVYGRAVCVLLLLAAPALLPACRTVGEGPGSPGGSPASPLVLLVLDRQRVAPGREWRFPDRVNDLLDAAVLARTGAEYPLDGWAALASTGTITVVGVPGVNGPLPRAVAARFALALGRRASVRLVAPPGGPPVPRDWILVTCPVVGRDGTVRDDGSRVAGRLRAAGWPPPALVLADLARPLVAGEPWEAREILVGTDPRAVAAVARWQLRGRLEGRLSPPDEAPRVRLAVLPVGE